jgi:thioesterase domain-containing protein
MFDVSEKSSAVANGIIPLFYFGRDPGSEPLAQALGPLHTFHGLCFQAPLVRHLKNPYSLRCIAEHFVRAIRETKSHGPYMLAGWGAHGVLALETAQMLRELCQEVALLVLVETINPERLRKQTRLVQVMTKLQTRFSLRELEHKNLRSLGQDGLSAQDYVDRKVTPGLTGVHGGFRSRARMRNSKEIQLTLGTEARVLYTAVENYLPRPYDSPVLLVRSRRGVLGLSHDTRLGWGKALVKELEVCETGGNHLAMYDGTYVHGLVEKLSKRLKNAEQHWQQRGRHIRQMD